ncbi:hypothetical protein NHX12_021791 [Muraenolepis orangiensis]|uniref:Essential protein Yae1 N-terminal domain-containing protein n=1 Tax=Muraenolepis orangiensis TaxID=630683 RepID=A0A9Q0EWE4_9TELE|nr:hypothetical protein NHX12_021791 [Muraenolepis orangiensis]
MWSGSGGVDDVFDEEADDVILQSKEWKHNMERRVKDGYVEGVDAGKTASLQVGFNLGYREGAGRTVALGRLKGTLSAVQCWCRQRPAPLDVPPGALSALLRRVENHEENLMKELRGALELPPHTGDPDDLGVTIDKEEDGFLLPGEGGGSGGCDGGVVVGGGGGGECGKEGGEGECCGEGGSGGGGGGVGGEGEGECKKTDCCQKDGGEEKMERGPCLKSSSSTSDPREGLEELVGACVALMEELGLPQELMEHLQALRSVELK